MRSIGASPEIEYRNARRNVSAFASSSRSAFPGSWK
jgi:hypothetical protein